MAGPDVGFWQERFERGETPWDRGRVNPQLERWIDAGELAPCALAVPGCGSGHEVAELARRGFEVTGLDYAPAAVARTAAALAGLDAAACARGRAIEADVLQWQPEAPFDAIYEQTCLCALHPDLWVEYAARLRHWLAPGGRLFALFVQILRPGAAEGFVQGPPYHCDVHAMRALFPAAHWDWPRPPYARTTHPSGMAELAVVLRRR